MGRAARTTIAAGVLAIVGITLVSLDLSGPTYDSPVAFDDRSQPEGAPLSDSEAAALREQADPNRLRCEPRGCELWRLDRDGSSLGHGVVLLDDGLLLTVAGRGQVTVHDDDGEVTEVLQHGHVLRALDPDSGEEAWRRILATAPAGPSAELPDPIDGLTDAPTDGPSDEPTDELTDEPTDEPTDELSDEPTEAPLDDGDDWLRLLSGPAGPLAATREVVVSLDGQGDERWRWQAPPDLPDHEWWPTTVGEDVVVLRAMDLSPVTSEAPGQVVVLDAVTGEPLWTRAVSEVGMVADLVVVSDDGDMHALDVRSGEALWDRPGEAPAWMTGGPDPWVITHAADGARVVDPATGEELAFVDGGWLNTLLTRVGDLWVSVALDGGLEHDPPTTATLVAFTADGSTAWRTELDHLTASERPGCCDLSEAAQPGDVRVTTPNGTVQTYAGTDGEPLPGRPEDGDGGGRSSGSHTWQPEPGVEVEWNHDGSRMEIRTEEGTVGIIGQQTNVESLDPLIVSDQQHLIGIQVRPSG